MLQSYKIPPPPQNNEPIFLKLCIIGEFKCTVFPIQMYKKV